MADTGKQYNIIYADPPWAFKVWSVKGKGRNAENHYRTLSADALPAFNVPALAAKRCALFLWATCPHLKEELLLGETWGFIYKTVAFVWVKQCRRKQVLFKGLGYYTRANAEVVLLFTKGKPLERVSKNVGQVLISRIGRHSQKPPEIRQRIVQLYGDLPRLELFARSRQGLFPDEEYQGWDVFGNEVNNSIEL